MKNRITAGLLLAGSLYLVTGNAKETTLEGVIAGYECGDNCYLTLRDTAGKEHGGLCTASVCQPWNDNAEMPQSFIGRPARVTVGKGKQYDGNGKVMGTTDAFLKIEWITAPTVPAVSLYFAADAPPASNAPAEAPLCYKFQIASLDEQRAKLKSKYPALYADQIVKNPDGSRSLLAKRKDEQGAEVSYFYTTSPQLCTAYQSQRLKVSSPATTPQDRAKFVLNKVYDQYDQNQDCWRVAVDEQHYCMKIDRVDEVPNPAGNQLYVLAVGQPLNAEGQEQDGAHATSGLVGAFVIALREGRPDIVAGQPKILLGANGSAPTDWKWVKLGPEGYWGWQNTWGDCHQGYCGSRYAVLAPQGNTVVELAGFAASFSDEGTCAEDECKSTALDSTLNIDTTQINDKVFPLLITVTGSEKGQPLAPKTWTVRFNTDQWSYVEPDNWPLKDREF